MNLTRILLTFYSSSKKRQRQTRVSIEQKDERRYRNRESAKRSRLRKKSILKSLQSSVEALISQNKKLRTVIKKNVVDADEVIASYIVREEMNIVQDAENAIADYLARKEMKSNFLADESLVKSQHSFLSRVNTSPDLMSNLLDGEF